MCNKFYGSKLNTGLLLILMILLGIAIFVMYQNPNTYVKPFVGGEDQKEEEIKEVKNTLEKRSVVKVTCDKNVDCIFKNEPMAIRGIDKGLDNGWVISVFDTKEIEPFRPGSNSANRYKRISNKKDFYLPEYAEVYSCVTNSEGNMPGPINSMEQFISNLKDQVARNLEEDIIYNLDVIKSNESGFDIITKINTFCP